MQALSERKTTRTFSDKKIPMQTLSNLLWAANGVNRPADKMRTSPSAHNAQEVEIYVSTAEGTYIYDAYANQLKQINEQDIRAATGKQDFVATAPVNLVYVADYSRFKKDDDETAKFYSATDTGFVSQNVYLFCASEGLVTMVRGYIDRPALEKLLGLNEKQHVILAQSVGYPK